MAGVKGRSGGARPGAGRKPRTAMGNVATGPVPPTPPSAPESQDSPPPPQIGDDDMLEFLQAVATGKRDATGLQVKAAIAAIQYTHTKTHDGGKKDKQAEDAKKASASKFGAARAPLKVVGGR